MTDIRATVARLAERQCIAAQIIANAQTAKTNENTGR